MDKSARQFVSYHQPTTTNHSFLTFMKLRFIFSSDCLMSSGEIGMGTDFVGISRGDVPFFKPEVAPEEATLDQTAPIDVTSEVVASNDEMTSADEMTS